MKSLTFLLNPKLLINFILQNEFIKNHLLSIDVYYHSSFDLINYVSISLFVVDSNNISVKINFVLRESIFHLHIDNIQKSINEILSIEINRVRLFHCFN